MERVLSTLFFWAIFLGIIAVISAIIFIVRRLSLDSESKDLEKVLDSFGNTNSIDYEIVQDKESTQMAFSPKELSEFIKLKHKESRRWKKNEYELFRIVKERHRHETDYLPDLNEITYKGLHIKCPNDWTYETIDKKNLEIDALSDSYPIIRGRSDDGYVFSLKAESTSSEPKNYVKTFIKEIMSNSKKFIHGTYKPFNNNKNESCYSCGYGYKLNDSNRFGIIIAWKFDAYHIISFSVSYANDWSVLCNKLTQEMINSVRYGN